MNKIQCSIGVFAYNEDNNIKFLLNSLITQKLTQTIIKEIIVVSSGSTDQTNTIVKDFQKKYDYIKLIIQEERKGKASAINLFMKNAISEILVISSADIIPHYNTIEKLIKPFRNPYIGMTGGRPIPQNTNKLLLGYSVRLLWKLHHQISIYKPKLGEMIAFRKIFDSIPETTTTDEAYIEALITKKNLSCLYVADAIIINKGPLNIQEFINQRKRIAIGHLWLKKEMNYSVSSNQITLLIYLFFFECLKHPMNIRYTCFTALLEIYSRFLAYLDFKVNKTNPYIWKIAQSTKNLVD